MMNKLFVVVFILTGFKLSSANQDVPNMANETYVMEFLTWKGYMREGITLHDALENYQEYMGVNATGEMDEKTMEMMEQPQCGVPDVFSVQPGLHRRKRYVLSGAFWPRTHLTYRISSHPTSIPDKNRAENDIHRAFQAWERKSNLKFSYRTGNARTDIEVQFSKGEHKDPGPRPVPFDGRGRVLAHAFFPTVGQIHFDDEEHWTTDRSGTNVFLVAVHEIGHALGLRHSIRDSIMFSGYQSGISLTDPLFPDDIMGIRLLYGPYSTLDNKEPVTTQTIGVLDRNKTPSPGTRLPNLCQDPKIDAITTTEDGTVYIFKADYYWVLTPSGLKAGFPRTILSGWRGLPDNVDAAVTASDGITYIFKGSEFWGFKNQVPISGPSKISSFFPRVPNNIDAAFIWPLDGLLHFVEGQNVWRYRYRSRYRARIVTNLNTLNLHGSISAAFTLQGRKTFFFEGGKYYLIDAKSATVAGGYPSDTARNVFGCKKTNETGPVRLEMDKMNYKLNIYGEEISEANTDEEISKANTDEEISEANTDDSNKIEPMLKCISQILLTLLYFWSFR